MATGDRSRRLEYPLLTRGAFGAHFRPSWSSALASTTSFRMMAVIATFGGFAGGDQCLVLGFQPFVEAHGDKRWQVERLAQVRAVATNEALAAPGTGLAGHGRQAGEARRLLGRELAKFRHVGEHGDRGCLADTWDTQQDRQAFGERGVGGNEFTTQAIDGGDLAFELLEPLHGLPLQERDPLGLGAVEAGGAIAHQSPPG